MSYLQNLTHVISGNTAGATAKVSTGSYVLAGGPNVTLSQNGNSISISAAAAAAITGSISAGTTVGTLGQVIFSNSNGISFGANGQTITGSHNGLTSQSVQTQSNVQGLSAGTQVGRTGDIVFSNSNGISFGMSNSSVVTASYTVPTQSVQTQSNVQGLSAGTQVGRTGDIVFSNSNGISFGMSNSSVVTASYTVPAQTVQPGIQSISGGTTRVTTGEVVFSNSNGISFGVNGATVTASYTVPTQTVQTQSNVQGISAGTQVGQTGNVVFSNSNGISFGMSNSSVVTASYTVPTQSVQTIGVYGSSNTTGQSSSSTYDARTMSFRGAGIISVGNSGGEIIISASAAGAADGVNIIAAGTQTAATTGSVVFSNSNGISFGMSNSSIVTASYTVPSTAGLLSAINVSGGTTSNNLSAITFNNANGVSFGLNASVMTASHNGITVQSVESNTFGISNLGNTSGTSGVVSAGQVQMVFAGGNNITLSQSLNGASGTITISGAAGGGAGFTAGMSNLGNTAGTTGAVTGQVVFVGTNDIMISQSVNGGSATVSLDVKGAMSNWIPYYGSYAIVGIGNANPYIIPLQPQARIEVDRAIHYISISNSSSTNSSYAGALTFQLGIYTRTGSTLSLLTSGSQSYQWTNTSNNSTSVLLGIRAVTIPIAMTLQPQDYWMCFNQISSTTNANWFTVSNLVCSQTSILHSGAFLAATNASYQSVLGFGTYSGTTNSVLGSIAFSQIRMGSFNIWRSQPVVNFAYSTV